MRLSKKLIYLFHILGLLLLPNLIILKFSLLLLNLVLFKTPYLCILNCIINIVFDFSWKGLVFSLIWLYESQDFIIGELPLKFRNEINSILNNSINLKPDNSEIFWTSLYADNKTTTNIKYSKELYNYISNLRYYILEFWFKRLNGFGTLINPANSIEQEWHIDYTWSYSSIFIPIDNCTSSNMTQILTDSFIWGNFYSSRFILDKDISNIKITIFKPDKWSLLLLPPSTYHRGVKNNSQNDRSIFWISYQNKNDPIEYEKSVQDFTKNSIDQI